MVWFISCRCLYQLERPQCCLRWPLDSHSAIFKDGSLDKEMCVNCMSVTIPVFTSFCFKRIFKMKWEKLTSKSVCHCCDRELFVSVQFHINLATKHRTTFAFETLQIREDTMSGQTADIMFCNMLNLMCSARTCCRACQMKVRLFQSCTWSKTAEQMIENVCITLQFVDHFCNSFTCRFKRGQTDETKKVF